MTEYFETLLFGQKWEEYIQLFQPKIQLWLRLTNIEGILIIQGNCDFKHSRSWNIFYCSWHLLNCTNWNHLCLNLINNKYIAIELSASSFCNILTQTQAKSVIGNCVWMCVCNSYKEAKVNKSQKTDWDHSDKIKIMEKKITKTIKNYP